MLELNEIYMDGGWCPTKASGRHTLVEAWTEEPYGSLALSTRNQVDEAVAAARHAFPAWAATSPAERIAAVERIRDLYQDRIDEMAQAISREMGAPISLARQAQAPIGLRHINTFLTAMEGFEFERELGPHAPSDRLLMHPVGVAALITPWNWPMNQVTLKVIAALLAGCTMVLKPSEYTPLSANLFASILDEAGLPPGVFNMVHGDGLEAGARLSEHPAVDMVSFTGSTRAGIAISKAAAVTLKKVSLELGGKGANIIFEDADDGAVERGVQHCFMNSGQSCNAPTRMLVERSIYDDVVQKAVETAGGIGVGPSNVEGPHIGPVISERQYVRVQSLIQKGIDEGATLAIGGAGLPSEMNKGYFVRPTIFADVSNEMTIAREEIFGPVLSIIPFETEDDAIKIANDTPYGLTNYVQSVDVARRQRVAKQLESGMIEMNGQPRGAGSPFGGVKFSGRAREGGVLGIEEFLESKAISAWC